jgi:hypothetical protein
MFPMTVALGKLFDSKGDNVGSLIHEGKNEQLCCNWKMPTFDNGGTSPKGEET